MSTRKKNGRVKPKGTQPVGSKKNNLGGLLGQASSIGAKVEAAKERAAATEVTGTAGGVKIVMLGNGDPVSVDVPEELAADLEMLNASIVGAMRDANRKAQELRTALTEEEVGSNIDLEAAGLSGLL